MSVQFRSKFDNYSIDQLEEAIMSLYALHHKSRQEKDELMEALLIRKLKMNERFEWTPENREKLLRLNQKLIECWTKIREEAKQTIETLHKRINEPDNFLTDYYVEAKVLSFIYIPDEDGRFWEAQDCIEEVLIDSLDDCKYVVNYDSFESKEDLDYCKYLDRAHYYHDDPIFDKEFEAHFISLAVHELYDHTLWSLPDILRINRLWAEVQVVKQHIKEI